MKIFNKSFITNILALILVVVSFYVPKGYSSYFYYGGLFALSGAITNWLAIYMLFNKIPLLYGSGVIELNFEKFKESIKNMVMEQFFTKERLSAFLKEEESKINLEPIIEETDFNIAFDALKESIMESKFGQFVNMFGGESSLELLRVTFNEKIKSSILSIVSSDTFKKQVQYHLNTSNLSDDLTKKIDNIVTTRLDELSPIHVKELVNRLIKEHLEWLVVWGGIFGGLLGVLSTFASNIN